MPRSASHLRTLPLALFAVACGVALAALIARKSPAPAPDATGTATPAAADPRGDRVLAILRDLFRIHRPSGQEGGVRDHLVALSAAANARLGRDAIRHATDAAGNILFTVEGHGRHATLPPIALQAHMDMVQAVSEAGPGEDVDRHFRDGVAWEEVDGWIQSTGRRTTLGADNGAGVALAARYLVETGTGDRPPLELLFTASEELGLVGARNLGLPITAPVLLNLDSTDGATVVHGCLGSRRMTARIDLASTPVPDGWTGQRVRIAGLRGGHSGEAIHDKRINAILLAASLLGAVLDSPSADRVALLGLSGGQRGVANVIPAHAELHLALDPTHEAAVLELVRRRFADALAAATDETTGTAAHAITADPQAGSARQALAGADLRRFVTSMTRLRNGVVTTSPDSPNGVSESCNLGWLAAAEARAESGAPVFVVEAGFMARGYAAAGIDTVVEENSAILHTMAPAPEAVTLASGSRSTPWLAPRGSWLVQVAAGLPPGRRPTLATGGIEPAAFIERYPTLAMLSLGPTLEDIHSPQERVSIQSVRETAAFLDALIEAIVAADEVQDAR